MYSGSGKFNITVNENVVNTIEMGERGKEEYRLVVSKDTRIESGGEVGRLESLIFSMKSSEFLIE